MNRLSYAASLVADHVLFGIALTLVVPPPPSMDTESPSRSIRAVVMAVTLLTVSRILAIRRKEESVTGAVMKLVVLVAFAEFVVKVARYW